MSINPSLQAVGAMLPSELWVQVLSFLPHADLGRAICTCKALSSLAQEAWKAACYRRWPSWSVIADGPDAEWRRVYELLELRESEQAVIPDVEAIRKCQTVINERHRGILTEWLYEVSHEWDLDSGIVYEAVKILDCYLTHAVVEKLGSFQLVGIACLRVAMRDFRPTSSAIAPPQDSLEASAFAHISADTYTADQVEQMTRSVTAIVPNSLNEYPNAKMHLRSLWFRAASQSGIINPQEMHIYSLSSFLLQLSLLDLSCCSCAPSHLAAAALSLSMTAFNKPAWPRALEAYGSYTLAELEPLRHKLAGIQANLAAVQLRRCWNLTYVAQGVEYSDTWKQAMAVFDCPSNTLLGLLGKGPVEAIDLQKASTVPPVAINHFDDEDEIVVEADDDTSSASTDSAIDGDIMLASAGGSGSLDDDDADITTAQEESDEDEGFQVVVQMVRGPQTSRGLVAAI